MMTVRKLLEKKGTFVSVVPPEATVQDILDQLEADDVAAVVVSADGVGIDGIVSTRQIARALNKHGGDVVDRPIADIMKSDVVTCDIGQPMRTIYELMDRHQIRHIPITCNGRLCGIVNMLDVVRHRLEELDSEAAAMKEYIAGRA